MTRGRGALLAAAVACAACRQAADRASRDRGGHAELAASPSAAPPVSAAPGAPHAQTAALRELTFRYDETPLGPSQVVVVVPAGATREQPLPVLVAFHGRGESLRGPARGARGWVDDYDLPRAVERLHAPPLAPDDLLGFVTKERLAALNASLSRTPYRGMIVVCPFLPDVLHGGALQVEGEALAAFVVDTVLPRVVKETPAIGTPETTAVDGVSLGGRAALAVGFLRPEAFRTVAALQPAIDGAEVPAFTRLADRARRRNPGLAVRLLSSHEDYFLEPTRALARSLNDAGVGARLDVVTGPHSYEFNRGPGVYEMLLFHDRHFAGVGLGEGEEERARPRP